MASLGVAAAGAFLTPAAPAALTPALEHRLAATPAGQTVEVIALMRRQVDGEPYEERPAALLRALRVTAERTQDGVADDVTGEVRNFWLVNAIAFSGTPDEVRSVAAHARVAEVDLDRQVRVDAARVNAAPFPSAPEGNWGLAAISTQAAWSQFGLRGHGVRVGSIDTGVNPGHPDLSGKVVAWRDFVAGGPKPYDDNGHGTHTAGTIAGGSSGGGPIGVAPGAQLVVAKAMASNGSGPGSALLAAAEWMTDPDSNPATPDQPAVINNSWSSSAANDLWFRPMVQRWRELGIVPVFSAGNAGPGTSTVGSPASYPEVVAVGALERNGTVAPFSSRGPVVWQNLDGLGPGAGTVVTKPDVAAPGVAIVSSVGNGYLAYSGTSMASPHVAGIVALMRQANPGLSVDQIAQILRASAVDVDAPGPDFQTGSGRVDAQRALAMTLGAAPAAPSVPAGPGADAGTAGATGLEFTHTPPAQTSAAEVEYRVRFTGAAELVRVRTNGGVWGPAGRDRVIALRLPEGTHVVEAQGLDAHGNTGPGAPARHRLRVDRTGPALALTMRRAGGRGLTFSARASDPAGVRAGSIRWDFGHGDIGAGAKVTRRFADDAPRRVIVSASDRLGNTRRVGRVIRPAGVAVPVRGLRVRTAVRGGRGTVTVAGTSRRPVRMTVRVQSLRRVPARAARGARQHSGPTALVPARSVAARTSPSPRGRFAVRVPVRGLAPGVYRVELRVGATRSIRTIRVR